MFGELSSGSAASALPGSAGAWAMFASRCWGCGDKNRNQSHPRLQGAREGHATKGQGQYGGTTLRTSAAVTPHQNAGTNHSPEGRAESPQREVDEAVAAPSLSPLLSRTSAEQAALLPSPHHTASKLQANHQAQLSSKSTGKALPHLLQLMPGSSQRH